MDMFKMSVYTLVVCEIINSVTSVRESLKFFDSIETACANLGVDREQINLDETLDTDVSEVDQTVTHVYFKNSGSYEHPHNGNSFLKLTILETTECEILNLMSAYGPDSDVYLLACKAVSFYSQLSNYMTGFDDMLERDNCQVDVTVEKHNDYKCHTFVICESDGIPTDLWSFELISNLNVIKADDIIG